MVSSRNSFLGFVVLIEANENIQEKVRNNAITEVNSSILVVSAVSVMCKEVITKRQKPKRFAEVFNICCEVVLGILISSLKVSK
jgi:hypothetical protein